MLRKIRRLPEATQNVLELCACIGQRFDLQTLSVAGEVSPEQAAAELRAALREGLVLPLSEASARLAAAAGSSTGEDPKATAYRFLHDRVQQAAYALIPDDDKPGVHLCAWDAGFWIRRTRRPWRKTCSRSSGT